MHESIRTHHPYLDILPLFWFTWCAVQGVLRQQQQPSDGLTPLALCFAFYSNFFCCVPQVQSKIFDNFPNRPFSSADNNGANLTSALPLLTYPKLETLIHILLLYGLQLIAALVQLSYWVWEWGSALYCLYLRAYWVLICFDAAIISVTFIQTCGCVSVQQL